MHRLNRRIALMAACTTLAILSGSASSAAQVAPSVDTLTPADSLSMDTVAAPYIPSPNISTTGAVSNTWQPGASMPTARQSMVAVTKGTLTYAIGGRDNSTWLTTNEAYNPATDSWTTKAPMVTARFLAAAALGQNGLIYVMGGYNTTTTTGANEAYNASTNTWTVAAAMPTPRNGAAAATGSNGLIYTFGGLNSGLSAARSGGSPPTTVEAYDPKTNTWTCSVGDTSPGCMSRTIPIIPAASYGGAAIVSGSSIYLVIGNLSNAVWAYDVNRKTWTQKAPMPTTRGLAGATVATSLASNATGLYVIGGQDAGGALSNAVEVYYPTTNRWAKEAPMPTARDVLAAATASNGIVIAVGGLNSTNNSISTSEVYIP